MAGTILAAWVVLVGVVDCALSACVINSACMSENSKIVGARAIGSVGEVGDLSHVTDSIGLAVSAAGGELDGSWWSICDIRDYSVVTLTAGDAELSNALAVIGTVSPEACW